MIEVISVYEDVARDNVNKEENGYLSYEMFNRLSRRAELRLLDFLTGDVANVEAPIPNLSQKNDDWISPFVVPVSLPVVGGFVDRPADFYGYENMYLLNKKVAECEGDEEEEREMKNIPVELLSKQKFYNRCNTFVKTLKPSISKPIAKLIGKKIEFSPKDLGNIVLEYYRYPKFAEVVSSVDLKYNDEIADPAKSINYEWDEQVRELLVYFITDFFSIHIRERELKGLNQQTGKLVRDDK